MLFEFWRVDLWAQGNGSRAVLPLTRLRLHNQAEMALWTTRGTPKEYKSEYKRN